MPSVRRVIAATVLGGFIVAAPAVADDRPPTPDERERIERALKKAGYTKWEEIEFDDGRWEVDDAIHSDGREYDLKLDPKSFAIVRKTLDD